MTKAQKPLFRRGSILLISGCFLVSPAFYNQHAFDNVMGYIVVGVGFALILIGFGRLSDREKSVDEVGAARVIPEHDDVSHGNPSPQHDETPHWGTPSQTRESPILWSIFSALGHLTLLLTVLGVIFLFSFARAGGLSGVPILFGLLVAGLLYGLAAIAKR